jgi:hypothetical protein
MMKHTVQCAMKEVAIYVPHSWKHCIRNILPLRQCVLELILFIMQGEAVLVYTMKSEPFIYFPATVRN